MEQDVTAAGVAERLLRARIDAHLSQKTLARRADMHQSRICALEKARALPTAPVLARLAKPLGVSVDWLLGLTDVREPAGATPAEEE